MPEATAPCSVAAYKGSTSPYCPPTMAVSGTTSRWWNKWYRRYIAATKVSVGAVWWHSWPSQRCFERPQMGTNMYLEWEFSVTQDCQHLVVLCARLAGCTTPGFNFHGLEWLLFLLHTFTVIILEKTTGLGSSVMLNGNNLNWFPGKIIMSSKIFNPFLPAFHQPSKDLICERRKQYKWPFWDIFICIHTRSLQW